MNILVQLFIILGFSFIGDTLTSLLHLPIPGSIIGLFLLFFALQFKIVKTKYIDESATWLKNNMAFLFVPGTVGIMLYFDVIRKSWFEIICVLVVSTIITYVITGLVAQWLDKRGVR